MRRVNHPPLFLAIMLVGLFTGVLPGSTRALSPTPSRPIVPEGSVGNDPDTTPKTHASSDALKKEFTSVIEGQLAAFRAGEYDKAYAFAAAQIRDMYPVESFKEMVTTGFPVIAHSTTAEFGLAIDTGEEAVINVRIEDADKKSILYQYLLEKQDGSWKIGGVSEIKPSGLSV